MQEIETLLVKSCAAQPVKPSTALQAMYEDDISFNTLKFQLKMLRDLIETANKQQQMSIKKVISINTICDIFKSSTIIPVTSATAERSFSTLRRVKNYLRTTRTEKCLNHLILLHSHKHTTDQVNVVEFAKEFSLRNDKLYKTKVSDNYWWGLAPLLTGIGGAIAP
uniref:HAT C-terminal dimerisation domain-containing protein n=1 Tax=Amphimedon queenslandica TaxID=400682 RepID=A0A1X7T2K0_AMPQE